MGKLREDGLAHLFYGIDELINQVQGGFRRVQKFQARPVDKVAFAIGLDLVAVDCRVNDSTLEAGLLSGGCQGQKRDGFGPEVVTRMFDQGSTETEIEKRCLVGAVKSSGVPAADIPSAMAPPVAIQRITHLCDRRRCRADPFEFENVDAGAPGRKRLHRRHKIWSHNLLELRL